MIKLETIYKEYDKLKDKYQIDKSLNTKEDLRNKLMELDYAINANYETELENNFPMTTTLEKEEERLEKLVSFVEDKSQEQKNLITEYKKLTGETVELSYLKYTDNLKPFKERLTNVRKIVSVINDIKTLTKDPNNKNELRVKVVKSKLNKKELLNLLYEFCLIDSLDTKDIEVDRLVQDVEVEEEYIEEEIKPTELPKKEKTKKKEKKEEKEEIIEEIIEEPKEVKKEIFIDKKEEIVVGEPTQYQQEEKILTVMPRVDKIGSVVPVNVFESLQKTGQKLPDVVLPSNGLKDDQNDIFVDTKDLFEEK